MEYKLNIGSPIVFSDIVLGIKVVETRLFDETRRKYKVGDYLIFCHDSVSIKKKISDIVHYSSLRMMLEAEGIESIFPSEGGMMTIDDGLKMYYDKFKFDKEIEKKDGCVAISFS
jgi:ASC-1-like (ASCH) protein